MDVNGTGGHTTGRGTCKWLEEGRGWADWSRGSWRGGAGTERGMQGKEVLKGQTEEWGLDESKPVASKVGVHTSRGSQDDTLG